MYPGSWKLKKIEASDFCGFSVPGSWKLNRIKAFDFRELSCTRGHESWRKSKRGHENWIESKRLIFVNFHLLGVMKVEENWSIWFLRIFLYPGSWKLNRIEASDFCELSYTRGHESWRKLKYLIFADFPVPGVMKIEENWSVWFLCTARPRDTRFLVLEKNRAAQNRALWGLYLCTKWDFLSKNSVSSRLLFKIRVS